MCRNVNFYFGRLQSDLRIAKTLTLSVSPQRVVDCVWSFCEVSAEGVKRRFFPCHFAKAQQLLVRPQSALIFFGRQGGV